MTPVTQAIKVASSLSDQVWHDRQRNRGRDCVFCPIDDCWGIKIYNSRHYRDNAYDNQAKAAEVGLGPDVGGTFEITLGNERHYCYVTERVELVYDKCFFHRENDLYGMDGDDYTPVYQAHRDEMRDLWDMWGDEADELKERLEEEAGFCFGDSFPPNWGIKNGRLICIDFG